MYCTNCGNEIVNDLEFCDKCVKSVKNESIDPEKQNDTSRIINEQQNVGNNDTIVLTSGNPLPDKIKKVKMGYLVFIVCIFLGIFNGEFLLIGLGGLLVWYTIDYNITDIRIKFLRRKQFKFLSGISYDKIFAAIQPILVSKYNGRILLERGIDGNPLISVDDCCYDILLNDNATFSILWKLSMRKTLISARQYKLYRNILKVMGIIGYEIQNAFGISA